MRRRRVPLATILCLLFFIPLSAPRADEFDDGAAYLQSGETERGIEILNGIGETGDAATQYKVGVALINFSTEDGVRWIEAAAQRGFPEAQRDMGVFYESGNGVDKDLAYAFMWYYLAQERMKDPVLRDDTRRRMKQVYAAMTTRERYNAEQLVRYWQPK